MAKYSYLMRGKGYRIYVQDSPTSSIPVRGEPIYYDKEEARKRVYELNGWKYEKPKS